MKRTVLWLAAVFILLSISQLTWAEESTFLIHLKTDLAKDDAQICVAYNIIWGALKEGNKVNVLIDASAVNTYKKGWRGKDQLEDYKIPQRLRKEVARQFKISLNDTPTTYGEYLRLLHKEGAKFYINGAMLVLNKISEKYGDMTNISAGFFQPVTLSEIAKLIKQADSYIAY